jgi:multidrug resistance efflux pump
MKLKIIIPLISLALLLTACSGGTPEAIPTVSIDAPSSAPSANANTVRGDIVASAVIVPAREASLAFVGGGNIAAVNVTIGQQVSQDDILVELDNTLAKLDVERAERTLREMTSPGAIAAAQEAVTVALENRDDEAFDVVALDYGRASQEMLDEIRAEITLAEKRVEASEFMYDRVKDKPLDNVQRADALLALNNAKSYLNGLRADYQWYLAPPSENDVAQTKAEANLADALYQEAVWYLAALQGEDLPAEASGAKLAALEQAQADLQAAEARLAQTRIIAPFDGVVAQVTVSVGDFVAPAQSLVIVSDLAQMQVKTTDLSERDIVKVKVGAPAEVLVDALGESFPASVTGISPLANTLGGDVVYEVTLSFDKSPAGVFGGMTAEVAIDEISE